MYRRHLEAKMEEQLVNRVTELPVVSTAMEQVTSLYTKTKEYNSLTRLTLQLAESGAMLAATSSRPVIGLFEPQLQAANAYGVRQLEAFTEAYPIVTRPTEEVVEETKAYVEKTVKPTYDRVVAPVHYTLDTYNSVKNYGVEKVNAVKTGVSNKIEGVKTGTRNSVDYVKDLGCNTVKEALETPYGKVVKSSLDSTLSTAEDMVDNYLPEDKSEEEDTKPLTSELVCTDESNPVARVSNLGNKVRQRMYNRAMKEVTQLQKRSREALQKLDYSVDLLKYAREHLDSAKTTVSEKYAESKEKMADIWEEVNREEDENEKENADNEDTKEVTTVERRTIMLARRLTLRLKTSMTTISGLTDRVLPFAMRARVQEMKQYSEEWFKAFLEVHSVKDIPLLALEQVKSQITSMQSLLSDMTDYILESPALNWMGLGRKHAEEIEMEVLEEESEMEVQEEQQEFDTTVDESVDEVDEEDDEED